MSREIVIVGAARTAVGSFNGAFANTSAHELGAVAVTAALERAKVAKNEVDEVILGQILTAGEGQNPARQAAIGAGIPYEVTAYGVNQLCGSGLRTVALGYQAIRNGDSDIVVGKAGFTGPPAVDGAVEIAYGVFPIYQGKGYATEAAQALIAFAFSSERVHVVRAHTLLDSNASKRVLTKCGFQLIGEVVDPEDGLVLRWEKRNEAA